jgi:ribosomal-protein-alanine acetyltransferase
MRVRVAIPGDVPRMVELVRATPTGAQWSESQFAKMLASEDPRRVILVLTIAELEEEGTGTFRQQQIPLERRADAHWVRAHKPRGEGAGEEMGRVEGFLVAQLIASECEIENIVVNPEWQRRGCGEALLREFLTCARGAGCEAVYLEVRESNHAARGLYQKCGFREVGRRMKYYAQPQEDAVIYRLRLGGFASETVQNFGHSGR